MRNRVFRIRAVSRFRRIFPLFWTLKKHDVLDRSGGPAIAGSALESSVGARIHYWQAPTLAARRQREQDTRCQPTTMERVLSPYTLSAFMKHYNSPGDCDCISCTLKLYSVLNHSRLTSRTQMNPKRLATAILDQS